MRFVHLSIVIIMLLGIPSLVHAQDEGYWELIDIVTNPEADDLVERTCNARQCTEKRGTASSGSLTLTTRVWEFDGEESNETGTVTSVSATVSISAPQIFPLGDYTEALATSTMTPSQGGDLYFMNVLSNGNSISRQFLGLPPDYNLTEIYSGPLTISRGNQPGDVWHLGFQLNANYAPRARVDYVYQWNEGSPDPDGDGVLGRMDGCPDNAGAADNWGCPAEVTDIDADGLENDVDPCPFDPDTSCLGVLPSAEHPLDQASAAVLEQAEQSIDRGEQSAEDFGIDLIWTLPLVSLADDDSAGIEQLEGIIAEGLGEVTFSEMASRLRAIGIPEDHPQWTWVFIAEIEMRDVTIGEWYTYLTRGEE